MSCDHRVKQIAELRIVTRHRVRAERAARTVFDRAQPLIGIERVPESMRQCRDSLTAERSADGGK